jgi:hypothetical protein
LIFGSGYIRFLASHLRVEARPSFGFAECVRVLATGLSRGAPPPVLGLRFLLRRAAARTQFLPESRRRRFSVPFGVEGARVERPCCLPQPSRHVRLFFLAPGSIFVEARRRVQFFFEARRRRTRFLPQPRRRPCFLPQAPPARVRFSVESQLGLAGRVFIPHPRRPVPSLCAAGSVSVLKRR